LKTFAQWVAGDNMQMGRYKNLLFAHCRKCRNALLRGACYFIPIKSRILWGTLIPNLPLGIAAKTLGNNVWVVGWGLVRFAKPLIVNFYVLLKVGKGLDIGI